LFASLLLFLVVPAKPRFAWAEDTPRVLVINSYHLGYQWSDDLMAGLQSKLLGSCELSFEFMDTKRIVSDDWLTRLRRTLIDKYHSSPPQVVVTLDDNAFSLMIEWGDILFPGVPVVFAGVNEFRPEMLKGKKNFTGLGEAHDYSTTVDIALKLFPKTRQVIGLSDTTKSGIVNMASLKAAMAGRECEFVVIDAETDASLSRFNEALKKAPKDTVVMYVAFNRDSDGNFYDYKQLLPQVSAACPFPMFSHGEYFVGKGVVGGRVINAFSHGAEAGDMVLRLLDGASPSDIPMVPRGNGVLMFDAQSFRRFGVSLDEIPDGAVVINKERGWFERNGTMLFVAVIALVLGMIAAVYIRLYVRASHAEKALRESIAFRQMLIEESPVGLALTDTESRVVECNALFCSILGRRTEDVIGLKMTEVTPEEYLEDEVLAFRSMDAVNFGPYEKEYLRPDGSRIPVVLSGRAVPVKGKRHLWASVQDISNIKQYQAEILRGREELRAILDSLGEGAISVSLDDTVHGLNPEACRITGWSVEEAKGLPVCDVLKIVSSPTCQSLKSIEDPESVEKAPVLVRKDGTERFISLVKTTIRDASGRAFGTVATFRDITDEIGTRAQLRQSLRLESIGRLAGGVAHDLNNLLIPIITHSEYLSENAVDRVAQRKAGQVNDAGMQAKKLTEQLIAFSRKKVLQLERLNLNSELRSARSVLRALVREDIEFRYETEMGLFEILGDSSSIQQVLLNLASNSQDAINGTGVITISTRNVLLTDNKEAAELGVPAGEYALLEFSDTGCGMDESVKARIFDPFYTTKGQGTGTGLGLSTVYGIVRQHSGAVVVESAPGTGTTFKLYFPACKGRTARTTKKSTEAQHADLRGSGEVILVVEDNEMVMALVTEVLDEAGYKVISAEMPRAALSLCENHEGTIDLLFSDVVMPEMNGLQLYEKLKVTRPEMKVLFVSGYSSDIVAEKGIEGSAINFLSKPFTPRDIRSQVRKVLDS
jgi:PAS domain S-box-containing protein